MALLDDLKKVEEDLVAVVTKTTNTAVDVGADVGKGAVDIASNALHEALELVRHAIDEVKGA